MEIAETTYTHNIEEKFKIDLIVWKFKTFFNLHY